MGGRAIAAILACAAAMLLAACGETAETPIPTRSEARQAIEGLSQHNLTIGSPAAPKTLRFAVALDDLTLPSFFKRDLPALRPLVRRGDVKIEIRPTITQAPDSRTLALAAIAAGVQNRLWDFLAEVAVSYSGALPQGAGELLGAVPGLDAKRAAADEKAPRTRAAVARSNAYAAADRRARFYLVSGQRVTALGDVPPGRLLAHVRRASARATSAAVSHDVADEVTMIRWRREQPVTPTQPELRWLDVLLESDRYLLTMWYPETFGARRANLAFGGTDESHIQPAAAAALAIATPVATDAYDPQVVGRSASTARRVAIALVSSLAKRHVASAGQDGWGGGPRSGSWAASAGLAGWMLWHDLDRSQRDAVAGMVQLEANRMLDERIPYFRDSRGHVIRHGNSQADDNAEAAMILQVATAMMPRHRNWLPWMRRAIELMIASQARPSDVKSHRVVNGRPLSSWTHGSNLEEDGLVVNRGSVDLGALAALALNGQAAVPYSLAGMATPAAATLNSATTYTALATHVLATPAYKPPGGTIYRPGSAEIYDPAAGGTSVDRALDFAALDLQDDLIAPEIGRAVPASAWEALHINAHLGLTRSGARERHVAAVAARGFLLRWLDVRKRIRRSNAAAAALRAG